MNWPLLLKGRPRFNASVPLVQGSFRMIVLDNFRQHRAVVGEGTFPEGHNEVVFKS